MSLPLTLTLTLTQLLVLMDGVAQLPVPTFVLALTNRRELIDSAILRPGRLEVHVEVGKPDPTGTASSTPTHPPYPSPSL